MTNTKKKTLIIIVFIAVAIFGALFIGYVREYFARLHDEQIAQENSDMIRRVFMESTEDTTNVMPKLPKTQYEENSEYTEDEIPMVDLARFAGTFAAFNAARELTGNNDIVAYIYIAETNISYAVVQGTDNDFYLHHDIFGNRNSAGSVFLDYLNSPDFSDPNTIIYGHNMNRGNKFHNLRYYVFGDNRQAFFEARPHILIITEYEVLIYEIFSVFTTDIDFYFIQVKFSYSEFEAFVNELNNRSIYDTGVSVASEDTLLLLSTCTGLHRDSRIVIASRLAQRLRIPVLIGE